MSKGIVLAGGAGTRLHPLTKVMSKQLLPVYDRPMICYPLETLKQAGIDDILVITKPEEVGMFSHLLGELIAGVRLSYAVQPEPKGIAQALLIGEDFVGDNPVVLILGDNIFHGGNVPALVRRAIADAEKGYATIFGYWCVAPFRYGVVTLQNHVPVSIEEKPLRPKSNLAVPGLYIYPRGVAEIAACLAPSARDELEITDVNNYYLNSRQLLVPCLGNGVTWFDAGTFDSLLEASCAMQARAKGRKV